MKLFLTLYLSCSEYLHYRTPICCRGKKILKYNEYEEYSYDYEYYDTDEDNATTSTSANTILPTRKKRSPSSIKDDITVYQTSFTIKITRESLFSLVLVQLPGVCLGLYGIGKSFQAHGFKKKGFLGAARSMILFVLPFFIVEIFGFLQFFLSSGLYLCCSLGMSQVVKKIVEKYDLIFFAGNKDKSGEGKILILDMAKVFFGSAIQLVYQFWILQVSLQSGTSSLSQYFSLVSSFLLICKTSYQLITYKILVNDDTEEKKVTLKEKIKKFFKMSVGFMSWFPLILTSVFHKTGVIHLYILFFGWRCLAMIAGVFVYNIINIFIIEKLSSHEKLKKFYLKNNNLPEGKVSSKLNKVFISYCNLFIINRPFESVSSKSLNSVFFLQPLQLFFNFIFICVYNSYITEPHWYWYADRQYYYENDYLYFTINYPITILIIGIINIILCFSSWNCSTKNTEMEHQMNQDGIEKVENFEMS